MGMMHIGMLLILIAVLLAVVIDQIHAQKIPVWQITGASIIFLAGFWMVVWSALSYAWPSLTGPYL